METTRLSPCPDCGKLVSRQAEACPSCGRRLRAEPPREGLFLRTMNGVTAVALLGPLFAVALVAVLTLIAMVLFFR
jgi:hypothetical protein